MTLFTVQHKTKRSCRERLGETSPIHQNKFRPTKVDISIYLATISATLCLKSFKFYDRTLMIMGQKLTETPGKISGFYNLEHSDHQELTALRVQSIGVYTLYYLILLDRYLSLLGKPCTKLITETVARIQLNIKAFSLITYCVI